MIQRPIYEYPKELLWHPKSMKWYLENDPNGLHKELADTLLQIRKDSINKVIDELRTKEKKYPLSQEQQELMECYNEAARRAVDAKFNSNTERMWYGLPPANSGAADAFANSFK